MVISGLSFASEEAIKSKMEKLKQLQDRVSKECINNSNAANYSVKIDGKEMKCPELLLVADMLRKQLDEEIARHKVKCESENKNSPATTLAGQAADIAKKAEQCEPSPDSKMCGAKFACGFLSVTVPIAPIASLLTKNKEVQECAAQAKQMPGCLANVLRGIFDSIWSAVTMIWDVGKWAVTSVGEWLGLVKKAEASTSEKAMMAQQASPSFLKQLVTSPIQTMKAMAKSMYDSIEDAAVNHYGCEKWSGIPFTSTCLKPMTTWKCGSCQQKAQVWCGIAGYAAGEIGTAFLTGGLVSGGKIALKGAVRLASGPAKNVAAFIGKTFPKVSVEVAEAAVKLKNLASLGFTAAQTKLFSAWEKVSNSALTKAISTAATKSGAKAATSIALKPVSVYLKAMDDAFLAGMNTVDKFAARSAKAAAGAKIADEALGVATPGLVIEADGSKVAVKATEVKAPVAHTEAPTPKFGESHVSPNKPAKAGESKAAVQSEELSDVAKLRADPEYAELFKGAEMYPDHHKELSQVIKAMEESTPKLTKGEIRRKIQETLNSCSL
jgi:hypothetical protein